VPALAPGTPQGYTAAGPGSPAAAPRSRESSPHAVRGTGSSSGQRQDTAADMGGALTPGAPAHMGSRLSSATGQSSPASASARDQQQQQQLALLPEDQAQQQMVLEGATDTCSSDGDADHAGQLSSLYGLSLSAAICVADLVRQVNRPGALFGVIVILLLGCLGSTHVCADRTSSNPCTTMGGGQHRPHRPCVLSCGCLCADASGMQGTEGAAQCD
jgi:hypothetical protein